MSKLVLVVILANAGNGPSKRIVEQAFGIVLNIVEPAPHLMRGHSLYRSNAIQLQVYKTLLTLDTAIKFGKKN